MGDRMVTIAIVTSRSEAMVLASLLDAGGVLAHIGGYNHAAVAINPIALGGFRFQVPSDQYAHAAEIISQSELTAAYFSKGLQVAVLRFIGFWLSIWLFVITLLSLAYGVLFLWVFSFVPLSVLSIPVNLQGGSVYYIGRPREI